MEFFRNTNIDFLGKKWYFLAFSLVFSVAGLFSMLFWHHIPYGVDFRGGTLVYVKFSHPPDDNALRAAMDRAGLHNAKIQRYDVPSNNEVLIDLDVQETSEQALDNGKNADHQNAGDQRSGGQAGPEQLQFLDHQELSDGQRPDASGLRCRPEIHPASPGDRRCTATKGKAAC